MSDPVMLDPGPTALMRDARIEVPLICGAMYPCSNPELVAAASEAGAIGIVQPISMEYVHGRKLADGLRYMRTLTKKPIGFNALVESSSRIYEDRMRRWVDIALEEGIRFFITALGKPRWVVEKVHAASGIVYHDVTNRRWAERAVESEVDGLICVNRRAGGHAGQLAPEHLAEALKDLGIPLVCAGGVGAPTDLVGALRMGYAGVQMGTRFIATEECTAHADYKQAILRARARDIVLTDKISGVPVAVIKTPFIEQTGTRAGWLARRMLRHPKLKHWMRMLYSVQSLVRLKHANQRGTGYRDYFQAGQSVEGIEAVEPVAQVVDRFRAALDAARRAQPAGALGACRA